MTSIDRGAPAPAPPSDGQGSSRAGQCGGVVVMAASAGGIRALRQVLRDLPPDLSVPLLVVQHLDPSQRSHLVEILSRWTPLRVRTADRGARLEPGTVYLALPGHHLVLGLDATLDLSDAPRVHFVRPSADILFESAAAVFEDRSIAVVLTGTGRDGANGVIAVKRRGGCVIAQQPAEFSGMPQAAIATGQVDLVLPLEEIATKIRELVETRRQHPAAQETP